MQKFKHSAVVSNAEEIEETGPSNVCSTSGLDIANDNGFAQWSADNLDHNVEIH